MLEQFKRAAVPEEEGLVGGDGIDDFLFQQLGAVCLDFMVELGIRSAFFTFQNPAQAGFNQIGLGRFNIDAGQAVDILGKKLDLLRLDLHRFPYPGHRRSETLDGHGRRQMIQRGVDGHGLSPHAFEG